MTDTVLNTLLAVSGLIVLVLLTRRAVSRRFGPKAAYALWALPGLRLLMPTLSVPAAWLPQWAKPAAEPAPALRPETFDPAWFQAPAQLPAEAAPDWTASLPQLALALWVSGIVLGTVWIALRHIAWTRRLERHATGPDARLHTELDRAAELVGVRAPRLRVLEGTGPLIVGLFRPVIVVPDTFRTDFDAEQRRFALMHECMHVKRGDLWTASLVTLFRLANWPNPLVHLAWPRFRADQEAACDADVLRRTGEQARAGYAETLLHAATLSGRATPAFWTGLSLSLHHPVKERLMILGTSNTKRGMGRWALAALLMAGTALSAPVTLADDPAPKSDPEIKVIKQSLTVTSTEDADGARVFAWTGRDGETGTMTAEELFEEYGIEIEKIIGNRTGRLPSLDGEPGLEALKDGESNMVFRFKNRITTENDDIEVTIENGERKAFRIDEDGNRTEVPLSELDGMGRVEMRFPGLAGKGFDFGGSGLPRLEGSGAKAFFFGLDRNGTADPKARISAAQSMLDSTDEMIAEMKDLADGKDARTLREAERELRKALAALAKAEKAMAEIEAQD